MYPTLPNQIFLEIVYTDPYCEDKIHQGVSSFNVSVLKARGSPLLRKTLTSALGFLIVRAS